MKLIDKDALVVAIERIKTHEFYLHLKEDENAHRALNMVLESLDTIKEKDVDLENYNKVKRTLSLSFMNFLDNNRPDGKMCLSNGECFDIDKAFDEMDFAKLFRYVKKYLKL